jgi:Spy/CpxP family protein refolding chaperone
VHALGVRLERGRQETAQRTDFLLQRGVERRTDLQRHLRQQLRDVGTRGRRARRRRGNRGFGHLRRRRHDDCGLVGGQQVRTV